MPMHVQCSIEVVMQCRMDRAGAIASKILAGCLQPIHSVDVMLMSVNYHLRNMSMWSWLSCYSDCDTGLRILGTVARCCRGAPGLSRSNVRACMLIGNTHMDNQQSNAAGDVNDQLETAWFGLPNRENKFHICRVSVFMSC